MFNVYELIAVGRHDLYFRTTGSFATWEEAIEKAKKADRLVVVIDELQRPVHIMGHDVILQDKEGGNA